MLVIINFSNISFCLGEIDFVPSSGKTIYLKASKLGEVFTKRSGMCEKRHRGAEQGWRDEGSQEVDVLCASSASVLPKL